MKILNASDAKRRIRRGAYQCATGLYKLTERVIDIMKWLLFAAGISLAGSAAFAQDQDLETTSDLDDGAYPLLLDGTLSGHGDLKEGTATKRGFLRFDTSLSGWEAWKEQVRKNTGISFGGSLGVMWQNYSDTTPLGDRDAVGGKLTFNISRDLINAGTPEALTLAIVIEDRQPVGTELTPQKGGVLAGSIVPTATTYGEFDHLGISQFYIRQNLFGNRFQYTIGKLFAPAFINAYPFFDDNRQFFNQTFSTSPTIPSPLRGFGAVGVWYPTEGGQYVQGGVFSANSDNTGFTLDDVFETGELFYNLELGWSGLARKGVPVNARGPMDTNNAHLSFWYKDAQPEAAVTSQPSAKGVAFNANFMVGQNYMWFVRGGYAQDYINRRNLTAGFGYRPSERYSDLLGFGVGWVEPSNAALRDQYTAEAFYRFQVTSNLAVTPNIQYIRDPALNPSETDLWVFGMRARVTF